MNNLTPENLRSIAAECVDACKANSKGKATQEVILTVLRKRAGFQSNQSFDKYVQTFNKASVQYNNLLNKSPISNILENDGVCESVLEEAEAENLLYRDFQSALTNEDGEYYGENSYIGNLAVNKLMGLESSNFDFCMESNTGEEAIVINGKHHGIYILSAACSEKATENILNKCDANHIDGMGNSKYYVSLKFNSVVLKHTFDSPHLVDTSLRGYSNFHDAVLYAKTLLKYLDSPYEYLMSDLLAGKIDPPKPKFLSKEKNEIELLSREKLQKEEKMEKIISSITDDGIYIEMDNCYISFLSSAKSPVNVKKLENIEENMHLNGENHSYYYVCLTRIGDFKGIPFEKDVIENVFSSTGFYRFSDAINNIRYYLKGSSGICKSSGLLNDETIMNILINKKKIK